MELFFERRYPHPIDKVWNAIATSEGLEQWLMQNDFKAVVGRASVFRFCEPQSDIESLVHVTVEALEPPRFMKWRWRHEDEPSETTVTFELEPTAEGTLLRLRHEGEVPPFRADLLDKGWPAKLGALGGLLSSSGGGS